MIDNINIKKELLNSTKVKIGIVGSRRYDNLSKMNTIFDEFEKSELTSIKSNYCKIVNMTYDEKIKMYMKSAKKI